MTTNIYILDKMGIKIITVEVSKNKRVKLNKK